VETGIASIVGNENFKIYPNPNTGLFTLDVDLPGETDVSYMIYTFEGKVIEANEIQLHNKTQHEFDLSKLGSGIYYIKLVSDEGTFNYKIMIK